MRKFLAFLVGLSFAGSAFADGELYLAPINTANTFQFTLLDAAGLLDVNETDGGTDVSVACDNGAEGTATNDFVDRGSRYSISLTSGELNCLITTVVIAGEITNSFKIQTYGASSSIPALPAAAAGASGGVLISGSNSGTTTLGALTVTGATTFTGRVDLDAGLDIAQSTSNADAVVIAGNGTGDGVQINSGSGATGNALNLVASSTNGHALAAAGSGSGEGGSFTGGATGNGLEGIGGATSGAGGRFAGTAGNSTGLANVGQGSAAGQTNTGGATGAGQSNVGGATSGAGQSNVGTAGNSTGQANTGQGSAAGETNTGGATGAGQSNVGGATSGAGLLNTGTAGNSPGASNVGQGSAAGQLNTGGATGEGARYVGGATSGNAIGTSITAPIGAAPELAILESGTLQSATSTTAVLRSATSFADDFLNCAFLEIIQGTGVGQRKSIDDWTSSTDTATVTTWTTTPDNTSDYIVWGTPCTTTGTPPTVAEIADGVWDESTTSHTTSGTFGEQLKTDVDSIATKAGFLPSATAGTAGGLFIAGTNAATTVTTAFTTTFTGNLTGSVASVTGNVGGNVVGSTASVTGNVGGNVTGTVGGLAAQAITDVRTGVDAELDEIYLDQLIASEYNPASPPGNAGSLLRDLTQNDLGVTQFTANALEQGPSGSGGSSPSTIADAVWDEQIEGAITARCAMAINMAALAGTYTISNGVQTFRDYTGATQRIVGTITSTSRSGITVTCP